MMKRLLATLSLLALVCTAVSAEDFPNGLVSDSVDPSLDSTFIKQIRKRLDAVRAKEHRPTVALVLCGGGAKGAAEVGVMHLIEDMKIPIDFVCGTSIGGLIGGLYSVGYDVAYIDSLFRNQDWKLMLSDRIESEYFSLASKKYKSRYQLSIPFHYEEDVLKEREKEQEIFSSRDGKLHLNGENAGLSDDSGFNPIIGSLPSGYAYGHHINRMLSDLTVGYQDSLSFADLPIPFCCVATELVSCKAKYWGSGDLKTAMRSSMGIPGMFTPIRTDGMVLSDGGTRNNFPVDIAKAVGADIIIGIDLTDPLPPYSKINNVGTVLRQFVAMLIRANHDDLAKMTDVYIRPKLDGFTSLSFKQSAVDSLLANGYKCALEHQDELEIIRRRTGGGKTARQGRNAIDLNKDKVILKSIYFSGMTPSESRILQKKIEIDITKPVGAAEIEQALAIIRGTGAVETVTYSLKGQEEPFDLVFNCAKAPSDRVGFGLRLDTEIWAELGFNYGWNINKLSGPKLDLNVKLGHSQAIDLRFIIENPDFPTINLEAGAANVNGVFRRLYIDGFGYLNDKKIDCGYFRHYEKLYISLNDFRNFESRIGIRNCGYRGNTSKLTSETLLISGTNWVNDSHLGAFITGSYYTLDNAYCPTRGVDIGMGLNVDFLKYGVPTFKPAYDFRFDIRGVIPFGDVVALITDFHVRNVFDDFNTIKLWDFDGEGNVSEYVAPEYSIFRRNFIGGDIAGRYIEQQIPFIGFGNVVPCMMIGEDAIRSYDHIAVLNLDLRVKAYKNLYVSALGGYAHLGYDFQKFITYKETNDIFAAGLQLTYDTIAGPIKARCSWSNRSRDTKNNFSFYLGFGFNL